MVEARKFKPCLHLLSFVPVLAETHGALAEFFRLMNLVAHLRQHTTQPTPKSRSTHERVRSLTHPLVLPKHTYTSARPRKETRRAERGFRPTTSELCAPAGRLAAGRPQRPERPSPTPPASPHVLPLFRRGSHEPPFAANSHASKRVWGGRLTPESQSHGEEEEEEEDLFDSIYYRGTQGACG